MAGFNDFVQTELPLRPSVATDGAAGQMLVRSTNPLAPREMVWADPAAGGGALTWKEPVSVYNAGSPEVVFISSGDIVVSEAA